MLDGLFSLAESLDASLLRVINSAVPHTILDALMPLASNKQAGLWLAALMAAFVVWRSGQRWAGAIALTIAAVAVSDCSATLLKTVFHRVRPCHVLPDIRLLVGCTPSFALPSNHAANLWAVATLAWAVRAPWRWPALGLAAAVGYSRIYLGVHYPSDVLVGALVGAAASLALAAGARRINDSMITESVAFQSGASAGIPSSIR